MSHADDMRQRQLDIEQERRLRNAEFLKHHPEYSDHRKLPPVERVRVHVTPQRVRELLSYDATSGAIKRVADGSDAVFFNARGYGYVSVEGRPYLAHRIAWAHYYGRWPDGVVDHIDHNKANNSIANLRDVSHRENCQNIVRPPKHNTTGLLGVSLTQNGQRFRAYLKVLGRQVSLGTYDTAEEAHAAYLRAKNTHHAGNTLPLLDSLPPVLAQAFAPLIVKESDK